MDQVLNSVEGYRDPDCRVGGRGGTALSADWVQETTILVQIQWGGWREALTAGVETGSGTAFNGRLGTRDCPIDPVASSGWPGVGGGRL